MQPINIFTFSQLDCYTNNIPHNELLDLKEKSKLKHKKYISKSLRLLCHVKGRCQVQVKGIYIYLAVNIIEFTTSNIGIHEKHINLKRGQVDE